jgi:methylated-DNA-[protein]-cysteine S-methyltransferase
MNSGFLSSFNRRFKSPVNVNSMRGISTLDPMRTAQMFLSPIGTLTVETAKGTITRVSFGKSSKKDPRCNALLKRCLKQLQEYFHGKRRTFSLPLAPVGTVFERRVWRELQHIPYGETASYATIARAIGKPAACRAVGRACAKNPIPLLIPCHRIIAANGSLGGYSGGKQRKQRLLRSEQRT